ncbi:LysR family transcriptional regulator [Pelagivirga sediminicola]|uniref:LysR family transcriptional regulator n=1 Tax=Pelagivirga sediminicola TaxID=2170575 RepID=A0A2T7G3V6_9RHOB|nr:LysR family transcriptional regulator [Pelagivirga sediminicola]PVA09099.1 LysR family transcriptional regulator [Pelagivirga sediminicola]
MQPNPLPHLTWLRAFEAAARHLSFTLAAQELGLTQPAVSQHVRNLELYLGRDLFIRRTRALALTEAGGNYLPTVREAFDTLERGTRSVFSEARGKSLIVQCNLGFALFWLTPRLKAFQAAHPGIALNIVTPIWDPERNTEPTSLEIRFAREGDAPHGAERLTRDRFYPVCRPDYQGGAHDLDSATLFECSGLTGTWEAWYKSQARPFARWAEVNRGSTFGIAVNAALEGAGVAMVHDTLVADMLADGRLVQPFGHAPPLSESYYLIPPPKADATPASRAFAGWVRAQTGAA